jgi:hypothetical protein
VLLKLDFEVQNPTSVANLETKQALCAAVVTLSRMPVVPFSIAVSLSLFVVKLLFFLE